MNSQERWAYFADEISRLPPDNAVEEKAPTSALLSLSGGMDSVTLLAHVLAKGRNVTCVSFEYGSKHNDWEKLAATKACYHFQVPLIHIGLGKLLESNSALMKDAVELPKGHYEEESMRQTVVPGRNTIFAGILMAMAESKGIDEVYLGIHSGDHFIYPDCRPEWLLGMQIASYCATQGKVNIVAPYISGNKTSIIAEGTMLHVPYELTRTCYSNDRIACGKCGACQERLEAFAANGIVDPIEYQSRVLLPKTVTTTTA